MSGAEHTVAQRTHPRSLDERLLYAIARVVALPEQRHGLGAPAVRSAREPGHCDLRVDLEAQRADEHALAQHELRVRVAALRRALQEGGGGHGSE